MKYSLTIFFSLFLLASPPVLADCIKDQYGRVVCGTGQCEKDQYGKVFCAQAGGAALRDKHGIVACGIGQCEKDSFGEVVCSIVPGGGASRNSSMEVQCFGGCQAGSPDLCEAAR